MLRKIILCVVAMSFFCTAKTYAANVFFDAEFWKTASLESVEKAIQDGADIKAKSADGTTALMYAAKYGSDVKILESLIKKHKLDVSSQNSNGDTALSLLSTAMPKAESVQLLLDNGAKKNSEQIIQAYNNAVNMGATDDVIELLLANSGAKDAASAEESMSNAPLPVSVPAPKSTQLVGDATTNPFLSSDFWKTADVSKVQEQLDKGHDINTRDAKGKSPLIMASSLNKDAEVIKTLLAKGAKVDDKDAQDWNALMHAAASNGHPDVIDALMDHGADVNARDKAQWTPLMAAITLNPHEGIIDKLLARGAQVNATEIEGKTALMLGSVNNQSAENINKLLNNGADLKPKDKNDKTALDYAKENTELSKTGIIHRLQ